MNINFVTIIIFIIMMVLSICFLCKQFKKNENPFTRAAGIIPLFIVLTTLILFYLDFYDFPSKMGYTQSMNANGWFNYLGQLFASIISGIILIWITLYQIDKQNKNNKEDKRINNAPILKYIIQKEKVKTSDKPYWCLRNGNPYSLFINMENIGLNHAKNTRLVVMNDTQKEIGDFIIDGSQSFLKKGENIWLEIILCFNYDKKNKENNVKKIKMIIYYDDLLQNKYRQEIDLSIYLKEKLNYFDINSIEIHNEELINKDKR